MRSWPLRILLIVIVAGCFATLLPGVREELAIDECVDGGGVYDYATHVCRTDVISLPGKDASLFRAPDRDSIVVGLAVAIAMICLFFTLDRRRNCSAS
jgi:hypothetical protein